MASTVFKRISPKIVAVVGMTSMTGFMSGCVSYTNVPGPESAPAFQSVNHMQSISVVTRALETVIVGHPVTGAYVINLPAGTSPESFEKIIAQLPEGAMMPSDEMSDDVPVYHIGRIWVRASDAKVDVIYPFMRADGTVQDQNVTIWLSGGVRKWKVYREQYWAAGTIPTPPMVVPIVPEEEIAQEPVEEQSEVLVEEPVEELADD